MRLRDLVISAEELITTTPEFKKAGLRFQLATFCVVDLYLQCLGKRIITSDTTKVIIEVTMRPPYDTLNRIAYVSFFRRHLDLIAFDMLDEEGQRRFLLEFTHAALLALAKLKHWNIQPLQDAYFMVLERDIRHQGWWKNGKTWTSPSGIRARVYFDFGLTRLVISCVIYDSADKEIGRQVLVDEAPSDDGLGFCLGSGGWSKRAKDTFVLRSRHGSEKWSVRLSK